MTTCSVKLCGKTSRNSNFKNDGITFHRFPKCPEMKEKWIEAACRGENWFPTKYSVICSRHFMADNFHNLKGRRRLMDSAIPILNVPLLINVSSDASLPIKIEDSDSTSVKLENTETEESVVLCHSLPNTPSEYNTFIQKKQCRRIIELMNVIKNKNLKLRKLRYQNRRLIQRVAILNSQLDALRTRNNLRSLKIPGSLVYREKPVNPRNNNLSKSLSNFLKFDENKTKRNGVNNSLNIM